MLKHALIDGIEIKTGGMIHCNGKHIPVVLNICQIRKYVFLGNIVQLFQRGTLKSVSNGIGIHREIGEEPFDEKTEGFFQQIPGIFIVQKRWSG